MKKDIFNFKRFGKYFVSDVKSCMADYGLSLITISTLILAIFYILYVGGSLLFGYGWNAPEVAFRGIMFGISMFCIMVFAPSKCYGRLTDKNLGSLWLMVPASKLEKFISMIIITTTVIPLSGAVVFLGFDALLCAVDPTCGMNVVQGLSKMVTMMQEIWTEEFIAVSNFTDSDEAIVNFVQQMGNPWLYVDDFFGMTLPFLLGAMVFKNGKVVKTFLSLVAVSMVMSTLSAPLMTDMVRDAFQMGLTGEPDMNFFFNSWYIRNIAVVDTIGDVIMNVGLLVAIFFRIKTLKH